MIMCGIRRFARNATVSILVPIFAAPAALPAENHVVSSADLQKAAAAATNARRQNAGTVNGFLSSATAQKALRAAGIDLSQVKTAVSALDDEDLARLAARSEKAQSDFAAGRISDRDLLIILVGIAALILIIVAVD